MRERVRIAVPADRLQCADEQIEKLGLAADPELRVGPEVGGEQLESVAAMGGDSAAEELGLGEPDRLARVQIAP